MAPLVDEQLDEVEVIHVRSAHRIVAGFDVAVVGGEVERTPAAVVGEIRIGAVVEQPGGQFVVPVLGCGEERTPAVEGGLIDIGAGCNQIDRAIEASFASGEYQRGQAAAVFGSGSAEESEIVGDRGFLVECGSGRQLRQRPAATAAAPPRPRRGPAA